MASLFIFSSPLLLPETAWQRLGVQRPSLRATGQGARGSSVLPGGVGSAVPAGLLTPAFLPSETNKPFMYLSHRNRVLCFFLSDLL